MSEDDLKTRLAVLESKMENLIGRFEKTDRNLQWAVLLIVGSVIATILKSVGLQ